MAGAGGIMTAEPGLMLSGLIPAVHTPFDDYGNLDLEPIGRQAELLAANGVAGVFVAGTTGESQSLTTFERFALVDRWREVLPEPLKLIVHVGHQSLWDAKALASHAAAVGADAVGCLPPSFFRPADILALLEFLEPVAEAAGLPFYYYHIPVMTGVTCPMYDFLQAAGERLPHLAGLKFTAEDLMDFGRCLALENGRWNLLFGRDEILLSALVLGCRGAVGSTYNYAAPLYLKLMAAWDRGELAEARRLQLLAMELVAILKRHGGIRVGKAIMSLIGYDCGPLRPPLVALDDSELARVRAELDAAGLREHLCRL